MTITLKFQNVNGMNSYRGAYPMYKVLRSGMANFDRETGVLTLTDDVEPDLVQQICDLVAEANQWWGAISKSDPVATDRQKALIAELALAPEVGILGLGRFCMEQLTKSQASRLIDLAIDVRKNGY